MLTFPSPPLKFRTAGFPQYGFKLDCSATIFVHPIPAATLYAANRPPPHPCGPCGQACGAISQDVPVQRPFALPPVVLSGRILRYYDLICASPGFPPIYALDDGPLPLIAQGPGEGPQFNLPICSLRATFRTPADRATASDCCFIALAGLRHGRTGSASRPGLHRFLPGFLTRLHSSLDAAARRDCSPFTDWAFTFELSPPKSPPRGVEYDYAGKQSIPATGLAPAR